MTCNLCGVVKPFRGEWPKRSAVNPYDGETALYEALLFISEFPNRWPNGDQQAIYLAEAAREALNEYESNLGCALSRQT